MRTPEEIRKELIEEFDWDVAEMARNYGRTVDEMTVLLQKGGEKVRRSDKKKTPTSFDIVFTPMVNVKAVVANPAHPTYEELEAIVAKAKQAVIGNIDEKISMENVLSVSIYRENEKPFFVCGGREYPTDPQILLELTVNAYQKLYDLTGDHDYVSSVLRGRATLLTEKYMNADWAGGNDRDKDFWLNMEEESTQLVDEFKMNLR